MMEPAKQPAIKRTKVGNRNIYMLQDGYDYLKILHGVRSGEIQTTTPAVPGTESHGVSIVKHDGRTFVLKKEVRDYRHFDARMKRTLFGSPFYSVMRKVNRAIAKGCDIIQHIYLVEEELSYDKETKTTINTAWLLIEFLPGEVLRTHPHSDRYIQYIPGALQELHQHHLVILDCNEGNFIVSNGKIKILDLYFFSTPFVSLWPRAMKIAKEKYGLDVPVGSLVGKIICAAAHGKNQLIAWNRAMFNAAQNNARIFSLRIFSK